MCEQARTSPLLIHPLTSSSTLHHPIANNQPLPAAVCTSSPRSGRLSGCCPPLHIACAVGDVDCLKLLLDAGADITAAEAEAGMTALHVASQAGQLSAVQALLAAGVSRPYLHALAQCAHAVRDEVTLCS